MRISIAGYSFHGALAEGTMDLFGYLESCRYRYQLDTADLWNGVLGKDPEVYLQPDFLRKAKTALAERGLTLANYHADGCHIWEDDPAKRAQHQAMAERHLAAAEYLGAKTVRIDAGGADRYWTPEQFDFIAARYRLWAQRAHNAGYAVGPETHWGAENHIDNQLALAKAVATPGYGILLHMGKEIDGAPDDYDRALAPYAVHTHIDQKTTYHRVDAALAHLIAAGYRGCLGVEHHTGTCELAEVAAQLALVRRAVAKLDSAQAAPVPEGNPLLTKAQERS